jgi:chromosome segregation and condensation protein ScpB
MIDHRENYKEHEIQLINTGKGWKYRIPKILGSRSSTLYTEKEIALEIAKGVIDHNTTL